MYEIIGMIFGVATIIAVASEFFYHAYNMYMVWVDDESIWKYHISYDPFMSRGDRYYSTNDNDGADITMSIIIRVVGVTMVPFIVGFAWPVVGIGLIIIGAAKYHKHIHQLRKEANPCVERGI